MIRHSTQFDFSRNRRFVYHEIPEVDEANKNLPQVESVQTVLAATIDDTKYTAKESQEKGEVHKFMQEAAKKAEAAIPSALRPGNAKAAFEKYGGEKAKGAGAALRGTIPDLKEGEDWNKIKTTLNLADVPSPLAEAIKKSKSPEEARAACDSFDAERDKREKMHLEAIVVDEKKLALLDNVERTVLVALEQKQKLRFEAAKKDYISNKAKELFPTDPTLDSLKLDEKRHLASTYMEGLMSGAELKADKAGIKEELDKAYKKTGDEVVKDVVEGMITGAVGNYWKDNKDCFYTNASPEVKAYMEGLLDSMMGPDEHVTDEQWTLIRDMYYAIPENERNYLPAFKEAFISIHKLAKFELRREEYIAAKSAELFPDDPKDPDAHMKRNIAAQYLSGLLSSADIHFGENRTRDEFDWYFNMFDLQKLRTYVEAELAEKETGGWRTNPEYKTVLSSTSPEVRAFMEGMIDSFSYNDDDPQKTRIIDDSQWQWIKARYNSIPVELRDNIGTVKSYFHNANSVYLVDREKNPERITALEILEIEGSPALHYFNIRMAKARETFLGFPGGQDAVDRYREMLLTEIGQQDGANIDMTRLNALPMPWVFEARAFQVPEIPGGAVAAGKLPNEISDYAKKLTASTGSAKINIAFAYDNHVYYAKNPPFQLYIMPESAQG
ncbi:MAG TPA: hypothetical protein VI588_01305 [Candidatus Gracilibacteria bacterium]|nr:hypothetical protein [Candidatus Gracilibacteria bacterium]